MSILRSGNTGYEKNNALDYYGRKITFDELFSGIDKATAAFANAGIKQGDIVAGITPSFPEVIYSFYAVNRLGAVSDYFDPRTDTNVVYEELIATKAKAVIIFEDFAPKFAEIIAKAKIPLVIVVSPKDSLSAIPKLLFRLKNKKEFSGNWVPYNQFIKENQGAMPEISLENPAHLPALMEHTGGTTGLPKAVVLSNKNINSVAHQFMIGSMPHDRSHSWLTIAFPFTAYSMVISLHAPLCFGVRCGLCYDTDLSKIENMLLTGRYNHMANTPVLWERLTSSERTKQADLSFLINPTVGADSMSTAKEKEINKFLKEHGCKCPITQGYGMTEVGSGASICLSYECRKTGSVGIPFVAMNFSVVDLDTGKELPYGEQGEICMSGPSVMLGYFNNQEATEGVLKVHEDGNLWMHSGDLGHIDEDGFIFIDGRLKRMIIDHHGFKIFAPQVEQVLSECKSVEKCSIIGVPDKEYGVGQIAVAYVILKDGYAEDVKELRSVCENGLPDYCVPSNFVFVKDFPYTSAAKVDYRTLEKQYCETH